MAGDAVYDDESMVVIVVCVSLVVCRDLVIDVSEGTEHAPSLHAYDLSFFAAFFSFDLEEDFFFVFLVLALDLLVDWLFAAFSLLGFFADFLVFLLESFLSVLDSFLLVEAFLPLLRQ